MALINSHAIGKASGSVGNLTFRTDSAGRTIASGKIVHMTNPQSEAQTLNRQKQTIAAMFFSAILTYLNSGWKRAKPQVAPYSEAVGLARRIAGWTVPELSNFAKQLVKTQSGTLEAFENFAVGTFTYDGVTNVLDMSTSWDAATFSNGLATDKMKMVLVNLTRNRVEGVSTAFARSLESAEIQFLNVSADDVYVVFPILKSASGLLVADSVFLGSVDAGSPALN